VAGGAAGGERALKRSESARVDEISFQEPYVRFSDACRCRKPGQAPAGRWEEREWKKTRSYTHCWSVLQS